MVHRGEYDEYKDLSESGVFDGDDGLYDENLPDMEEIDIDEDGDPELEEALNSLISGVGRRRNVGSATGLAATGGSIGYALGQVILAVIEYNGIDLGVRGDYITVLCVGIVGVIGGWLAPPKDD